MLIFVLAVSILIAFTLGYGVREIISRRRRKNYLRRGLQSLDRDELEVLQSNPGKRPKRRIKKPKAAVSSPEPPEHVN
jgi:hypothetical protein